MVDRLKMSINKTLAKAIAESKIPLSRIAERAGISRQHIYKIISGEKNISSQTLEKICNAINIAPSSLYEGTISKIRGKKIPVLGVIPAGIPIEAIEDVLDYEEISEELASRGEYFALKVKGDSMTPTINDGDVVIIKMQDDADSGKICVVMIDGCDATLKQIKKDPNGIWILPHNPNSSFQPTFYTNKEVETLPVRILGVAVEIRRSL